VTSGFSAEHPAPFSSAWQTTGPIAPTRGSRGLTKRCSSISRCRTPASSCPTIESLWFWSVVDSVWPISARLLKELWV
jgi:hypothetical protein